RGLELVGTDAQLILEAHLLVIREPLCWFDARDSDLALSPAEAVQSWVEQLDRPPGGWRDACATWAPSAIRKRCWSRSRQTSWRIGRQLP
ncbi:MAG: hypothetical protein ACK5N0_14240, partial [Synechococcaceae cyanobacterium]